MGNSRQHESRVHADVGARTGHRRRCISVYDRLKDVNEMFSNIAINIQLKNDLLRSSGTIRFCLRIFALLFLLAIESVLRNMGASEAVVRYLVFMRLVKICRFRVKTVVSSKSD